MTFKFFIFFSHRLRDSVYILVHKYLRFVVKGDIVHIWMSKNNNNKVLLPQIRFGIGIDTDTYIDVDRLLTTSTTVFSSDLIFNIF
jgi:hypothetical protein